MQLRIVAVGKVRERYVADACADFAKRIAPYYPLEIVEVKAAPGVRPESAMRDEAARVLAAVQEGDVLWLLDRGGEEFGSEEFSRKLARVAHTGARRMVFVIAGTYGADASLRRRADAVWSLSQLTFLHEWARAIVLEQIYRAAKIARNEPYHH